MGYRFVEEGDTMCGYDNHPPPPGLVVPDM